MNAALNVVNIGFDNFLPALRESGLSVVDVEWRPPAQGDADLIDMLFDLTVGCRDGEGRSRIDVANGEGLRRILAAQPVLRRIVPAGEALADMEKNVILHAGPRIAWEEMCAPMQGAVLGAVLYEKLAKTATEARGLLESGKVVCEPTYTRQVVAPMAGVVSYSMPVFVVENEAQGNVAFAPFNESSGQALYFGVHQPEVIRRLDWMEQVLAPALGRAVQACGGVRLKPILSQALQMGDDMHHRNLAATMAFYSAVAVALVDAVDSPEDLKKIVSFLTDQNDRFSLNLAMAACKTAIDTAKNIPYCSLVTAMNRNGVDFGLQISATGDEWITAPSLLPRGLYYPGYSEDDANPDMGDSAIIETYGLGGMALGAIPLVSHFIGAGGRQAKDNRADMAHICVGRNPDMAIPNQDFIGTPTGIDLCRVVATGIPPSSPPL